MGYSTDFVGQLKFTCDMTPPMLERLCAVCGEDTRDHPEWRNVSKSDWKFYHIDIDLNQDSTGIEWNGTEKSYSMEKQVQFVIDHMQEAYPDFGLIGAMEAQGEEVSDHWFLVADGDRATRVEAEDYYKNKTIETENSSNIEVSIS